MKTVGWDYEILHGWHLEDPDYCQGRADIPDAMYDRLVAAWRDMQAVQDEIDQYVKGGG